jgi:actin-like ATPase involved in cell morphogenesis
MAGNQMDEAIMNYLKRKYNLLIGERTAEQIKMEIGSAYPLDKPLTMEIKGRNLIEGVPKNDHDRRQRNSRGAERMRLDHHECDPRRAGAHPAGA